MSDLNSSVSWSDPKNQSAKQLLPQTSQQIFLLTVAYPEESGRAVKGVGCFEEKLSGQQHIVLQAVDSVLPVAVPSLPKPHHPVDKGGLEKRDGRFAPLVVLNSAVGRHPHSDSTLTAGTHAATYILPHSHSLVSNLQTHVNQFELSVSESTPVVSFQQTSLPNFPSSTKGILGDGDDAETTAPAPQQKSQPQISNNETDVGVESDSESEGEEVTKVISDGAPVPRAKLTLPTEYLVFKNIHSAKNLVGVFAKKEIPERAQFGPVKGQVSPYRRTDPACPGLRLIINRQAAPTHVLSTTNQEMSNWMRYVRVALKAQEQNLAVNQIDEELYFVSLRTIKAGQELRVWYSNKYASRRNLPLLTKDKEKWRCPRCVFTCLRSKPMNQHLAQHSLQQSQNSKWVEAKETCLPPSVKDEKENSSSQASSTNKKSSGCKMCGSGFCPSHSDLTTFNHNPESDNDPSPELDSQEEDAVDRGVVCDVCARVFVSSKALSLHYKSHFDNVEFECPLCNERFDKVLDMKNHIATHRQNGCFTCTVCHKEFGTYRQVRKHIRMGHSKHLHNCALCFKTFPSADRLKNHLLSHSNDRQFLCANCGKQFKRKDKLVAHMRTVHNKPAASPKGRITKQPPVNADYALLRYKCLECCVGFKKRGVLVNHMLSKHPDTKLDSVPDLRQPILKQSRDYLCQYCDKVYKSSTKRKAHIIKIHPGAKLPSNSSQEPAEETYTQTVGSISAQPQSCEWCSRQYASKAKLIQHQRKAHLHLMPKDLRTPSVPSAKPSSHRLKKTDPNVNMTGEEPDRVCQVKNTAEVQPTHNNSMEVGENEGIFLSDGGIIVDAPTLKKVLKLGDSSMECALNSGFEQLLTGSRPHQYFKILTQGGITIAQPVELWDPLNLSPAQPTPQTASDQGPSPLTSDIIVPP